MIQRFALSTASVQLYVYPNVDNLLYIIEMKFMTSHLCVSSYHQVNGHCIVYDDTVMIGHCLITVQHADCVTIVTAKRVPAK